MSVKNFTLITGFLFLIIGLCHILRILYGWDMIVEDWNIPMWVSGAGAIFAFFLSFESFRLNRKGY